MYPQNPGDIHCILTTPDDIQCIHTTPDDMQCILTMPADMLSTLSPDGMERTSTLTITPTLMKQNMSMKTPKHEYENFILVWNWSI